VYSPLSVFKCNLKLTVLFSLFQSNKLHSLQNGGMSSVEENIKRQLEASESEMGDLRSEIQILQSTVSFLLFEKIGISII
jgi:hypothetical protein